VAAARTWILDQFDAERSRWMLWLPVAMRLGTAVFFELAERARAVAGAGAGGGRPGAGGDRWADVVGASRPSQAPALCPRRVRGMGDCRRLGLVSTVRGGVQHGVCQELGNRLSDRRGLKFQRLAASSPKDDPSALNRPRNGHP